MNKQTSALLALLFCLTPFLLTVKDGYVALYDRETAHWEITDTPLSSLPPDDQALLPQGIPGVEMGSDLWGLMIVGGDEDKLIVNLSLPSEEYTLMLDLNHELEPTVLWGGQR